MQNERVMTHGERRAKEKGLSLRDAQSVSCSFDRSREMPPLPFSALITFELLHVRLASVDISTAPPRRTAGVFSNPAKEL